MVGENATANGSPDGNLAATYALIYSFLCAKSHEKAAAAVKKAVKDVVVLKDNVAVDGASLDEIVRWWKEKEEADAKHDLTSDSDSDSDSDSSPESASRDSSSDDSDTNSRCKNDAASPESASRDSSSDDSDTNSTSDSSDSSDGKNVNSPKAAKVANGNGQAVTSRSVVSNHKTDPGTPSEKAPKRSSNFIPQKSGKATKSVSPSSSSDSSGSDSSNAVAAPPKARQTATHLPKAGMAVVTAVSDSTTVRTAKKQRLSESGTAVVTAIVTETSSPAPNRNAKENGKKPRKSNTPFQRIKVDAVEFHDERLKDNAFVARGASANDYGARANQDLIVTRGDGFRKEKNKKKRGSYRGGEITMESHSIKFA